MTKINILEHIYICNDDAGLKLENYLREIQHAFRNEPEIIRDIELGIIEQLDFILIHRNEKTLELGDVEVVIQKMGDVHQMESHSIPDVVGQHLYRDYDNRIIAGVCSGIAAYFNLSAWLVRFIFAACFFTPLPVVIPYLLMWYFIPPALTKAEQLNMKGIPVNIRTIVNSNQYVRKQIFHLAKLTTIVILGIVFLIASIVLLFCIF